MIPQLIQKQRVFFNTGKTKSLDFRLQQLKTLRAALEAHTTPLQEAMYADLGKSAFESYAAEIFITIADINYNIKHLSSWIKPKKQSTPLFFQPGSSALYYEPYGVSLIIAPWNYPVKNLFGPALASMTAGNTLILKPSEVSSNTSKAIAAMIREFFDESYVAVIEGGVNETSALLNERLDYIFFTGGTQIGKVIYEAAAKHLTPCTLELGGKSPCIVDEEVDLDITAKRLVWGKYYNTGQTCVAPDYVLVHKNIKASLIEKLKHYILEFFGENPRNSKDFGRIISPKHVERLKKLMGGKIIVGGEIQEQDKYIAPTVIDQVKSEDPIMQEEIFGPLMPLLEFSSKEEAASFINTREKPLALYVFSKNNDFVDYIVQNTSSGGICVNETIMHMVPPTLPFGGVGQSGLGGNYNGWFGFNTFSHKKPVMKKSFWFDLAQKYPPYNPFRQNFIKFAIKRLI